MSDTDGAAGSSVSAMLRHMTSSALRPALLLLVVLAPSLVMILLGYVGPGVAVVLGTVLSVGAAVVAGQKPVLLAAAAVIPIVAIACVLGATPLVAALLIGILGLATGISARAGRQGVLAILPSAAAVYLGSTTDVPQALGLGVAVAIGVAYGGLVGGLLHRRLKLPPMPPLLDLSSAVILGLTLGLLSGALALAITQLGIPHGYWAILTLFIVFRPTRDESRRQAVDRVAGTLAGGLFGLLAVTLLDAPGVLAAAAIVVVYGGLLVMKQHPRWMVAASTAAIVLGAGTAGASEATALTRLVMVVAGVGVVLVAAAISEALAARHAARAARPA